MKFYYYSKYDLVLRKGTHYSAGYDIPFCRLGIKRLNIKLRPSYKIDTGIHIISHPQTIKEYKLYFKLVPRSSSTIKLINTIGVIDIDYHGPIIAKVYDPLDTLAQILEPQEKISNIYNPIYKLQIIPTPLTAIQDHITLEKIDLNQFIDLLKQSPSQRAKELLSNTDLLTQDISDNDKTYGGFGSTD